MNNGTNEGMNEGMNEKIKEEVKKEKGIQWNYMVFPFEL